MKIGYVSIIGKPNVGKSTLINAILNRKVSIVTNKSQTTRNSINAVYEDDDSQIIFVDTPGIHKPQQKLGNSMNKESYNSIRGADVSLFVLDAGHEFNERDKYLFKHLKFDMPLIAVFNKIDTTNIILVNKLKKEFLEVYPEAHIVEISAIEKFNIDELLKLIKSFLMDGSKVEMNDKPNIEFEISEIIRERALECLEQEIPHCLFIRCDCVKLNGKMIDAKVSLFVEKDSQKAIIIGKAGAMIKRIGKAARIEIEKIYHTHVNLELTVKVDKDWRNNEKSLKKFGFN